MNQRGETMRKILCCAVFLCAGVCGWAQLQKSCPVADVVPTENITSLEINPSLEVPKGEKATSLSKLTLKAYYAFDKYLNVGVEVPLARFESPAQSKNGLGDVNFSISANRFYGEVWSFGSTLEVVTPTASDDSLGAGKLQLNPSVYGVYMPQGNFFFALGYKQYWSVAGDGGRDTINQGRIRSVIAYLSNAKWWALVDPRYIMDYENAGQAQFAPEAEIGTMINEGSSIYLRGGGKMGGNMPGNEWLVSVGFRILHL